MRSSFSGGFYHRALGPWASIFLICFGLSAIAAASTSQFSIGVSLVEVYATVTNAAGEPVTGLSREAFSVEEDGVAQNVSVFTSGDLPLSLAFGIDRSFSVTPSRLRTVTTAVSATLEVLRPADRTLIMAIGSQPEILAPLGADREATRQALTLVDSWGSTPLYDAIITAVEAIAATGGRRALILLSDGADRYSRATAAEVIDRTRHVDVIVYPVAIAGRQPPLFAELAAVSGGRSFRAGDARTLNIALRAIARELRSQYLLGYAPPSAAGGARWRSIRVKVEVPGVRVRAREGYVG